MAKPAVVFQPAVHEGMSAGIAQLVAAIRPTLGPVPRIVAIDGFGPHRGQAELLDSGGLIARRILELPHPNADVGAMYLRHLLWQISQEVGDGTAAAALIFDAVYRGGVRFIAAGGNAMILRRHLEAGARLISEALGQMSVPLASRADLAPVIESVCYDPELARLLIEIHEIVGPEGSLDIRSGRSRELEREYVEGAYWSTPAAARNLVFEGQKTTFADAAILLTDFELEEPQAVYAMLKQLSPAGAGRLLIIARRFSPEVTAFLKRVHLTVPDQQLAGACLPGQDELERVAVLEDWAALAGGRPLLQAAGDSLAGVRAGDLGRARRAWVDRDRVGLARGHGDAQGLRRRLESLRSARDTATQAETRRQLQQRIGRLLGGSAVLWVGAATEPEIRTRKVLAERAALTVAVAARGGLVPGGGVALLRCREMLRQRAEQAETLAERVAFQILGTAVEAPIRALLENAGHLPDTILEQLRGGEEVFDVRRGEVVGLAGAGIWDATAVLQTATSTAVAGAALALTTDVIIHKRKPERSAQP